MPAMGVAPVLGRALEPMVLLSDATMRGMGSRRQRQPTVDMRRTEERDADAQLDAKVSGHVQELEAELGKFRLGAVRRSGLIFAVPFLLFGIFIWAFIPLTFLALAVSLAIPELDLQPAFGASLDWIEDPFWLEISTEAVNENGWVLPAAIATILGLYAALFTLGTQRWSDAEMDRIRRRLVWTGVVVGVLGCTWAWLGVPALLSSNSPMQAAAGFVGALLCALLAGEIGSFARTPGDELRATKRDFKRAEIRKTNLQGHPLSSPAMGWTIRALWLIGLPVGVTITQCVLLGVANQGGWQTLITINVAVAVLSFLLVAIIQIPVTGSRRWIVVVATAIQTLFAILLVTVFVRLAILSFSITPGLPLGDALTITLVGMLYILWGVSLALVSSQVPFDQLNRRFHVHRYRFGQIVPPVRGSLTRFSLASVARDRAWRATEFNMTQLDRRGRALGDFLAREQADLDTTKREKRTPFWRALGERRGCPRC